MSVGLGLYQSLYKGMGADYNYALNGITVNSGYNYKYRLLSTRLMAEAQLGWRFNTKFPLIPFVLLGVGPSLNFVYGYEEQLMPKFAATGSLSSDFKPDTTIGFAYQLGAGLSCLLGSEDNRFSIVYRYVGLDDNTKFDQRSEVIRNYKLTTGKVKINEFYLMYTHLFDL